MLLVPLLNTWQQLDSRAKNWWHGRPLHLTLIPCIENFWSLLKRKLYTGGKNMHPNMSCGIAFFLERKKLENLTKSVDNRLVKVLSNNGNYVNMYVAARNPPICHDIWRKYWFPFIECCQIWVCIQHAVLFWNIEYIPPMFKYLTGFI